MVVCSSSTFGLSKENNQDDDDSNNKDSKDNNNSLAVTVFLVCGLWCPVHLV